MPYSPRLNRTITVSDVIKLTPSEISAFYDRPISDESSFYVVHGSSEVAFSLVYMHATAQEGDWVRTSLGFLHMELTLHLFFLMIHRIESDM